MYFHYDEMYQTNVNIMSDLLTLTAKSKPMAWD